MFLLLYHWSKEDYKGLSQLWLIRWVWRGDSPPAAIHVYCAGTHCCLGRATAWGVILWLLREWCIDVMPHPTRLALPTP